MPARSAASIWSRSGRPSARSTSSSRSGPEWTIADIAKWFLSRVHRGGRVAGMATRSTDVEPDAASAPPAATPGRAGGARIRLARILLALLAALQGFAAIWALVLPRAFYDDFPGAGA